ncbi:MAG TPA: helix-turn-helix domain-containing protein [Roseiflexaceae bacterium]|nr:helix-turn-helix domain-containing protein [Roseiflexaceae bacterium]
MTLRERQRQAREDAIIDAAHQLLIEQGYTDMNMDELAARLGASKATLYQHFPSKEELAVRVIVRMMQRGEERMGGGDPGRPAIDRLEYALRKGLEHRAGTWAARINLLPQSIKQHPRYQAQRQCMIDKIATLVEEAKREGDIAPGLETPVVTRLIMNLFRSDFDDLLENGAHTAEQINNTIVELILHGIRNPAPKPIQGEQE